MRTIPAMALFVSLMCGASAGETSGRFLNVAILSLPERYLADIPPANRSRLLQQLSRVESDDRLDYTHGWLNWRYDGPPQDSPGATSMFWMKLLPQNSGTPLVFVHMSKPFNGGGHTPGRDQTFVLELQGNDWRDVTKSVVPKEADLTMHFRPRRSSAVIEVAAYESGHRLPDGSISGYGFGERKMDLIWEAGKFRVQKPGSRKLSSQEDG